MAAPFVLSGQLNATGTAVIVNCNVDALPLKNLIAQPTAGWTVWLNGATPPVIGLNEITVSSATVASPTPTQVTLNLATPVTNPSDVVRLGFSASFGDTYDNDGTALLTVLPAAAITVHHQPIINKIAANVETTLNLVDAGSSYLYTLTVVRDIKDPEDNIPRDQRAIMEHDDPTPEDEAPIGHEQFTVTFRLLLEATVSQDSSVTVKEKLMQMHSDAWKALNVDYTRGNLAVDTLPLAPTDISELGGAGKLLMNFQVRYRTLYGNPFAQ